MTLKTIPLVMCGMGAILMLSSQAHAADDMGAAMLANTCASCHGPDGKSPGAIPSLNHLSADYIAGAMKDFKTDKRTATVMNRIAKGYTDEEIERMAQYFSTLSR